MGQRGCLESHVFAALAEKRMPRLCEHLHAISFSLAKDTRHWFANLFVGSLPAVTVVRIWDALLCEGPKVLYRIGLALLKVATVPFLFEREGRKMGAQLSSLLF